MAFLLVEAINFVGHHSHLFLLFLKEGNDVSVKGRQAHLSVKNDTACASLYSSVKKVPENELA